MSELVNKIHSLTKTIIALRENVASERARYVDEVDHSEQLAFCLASIMSGATGDVHATAELTLKEHHARRVADELLPPLLPAGDV
jgi:hypothetical protein